MNYYDILLARKLAGNGGGGTYVLPVASETTLGGIKVGENLNIDENGVLSAEGGSAPLSPTTNTELGGVKTNSAAGVTLNDAGQLMVDGRMGQYSAGGIYYPTDRDPSVIGSNSFIICDANNGKFPTTRSFAVVTGIAYNLTERADAGSTAYKVADTYVNRITLSRLAGASAAENEASSQVRTVPIISVTINGRSFTPTSPAIGSAPIVITTNDTANPDRAITSLRVIGKLDGFCNIAAGQMASTTTDGTSGCSLFLGQKVVTSGNANAIVGADILNTGNGNAIFGRQHYNTKNRWLIAGTGHNTSNGRAESGFAVGQWSDIGLNTAIAVGNGNSNDDRRNIFEVRTDRGGTAIVNNIEAKNGRLEFNDREDVVPPFVTSNWTASNGAILGGDILTLPDRAGYTVSATTKMANAVQVKPGETLVWSFDVRKTSNDVTGTLRFDLVNCNASGGAFGNKLVIEALASTVTTDYTTYTGNFTVPADMGYMRIQVSRVNAGMGSADAYDVKNLSVMQTTDRGIYMTSLNGTKFKLTVDDAGNLSTIQI